MSAYPAGTRRAERTQLPEPASGHVHVAVGSRHWDGGGTAVGGLQHHLRGITGPSHHLPLGTPDRWRPVPSPGVRRSRSSAPVLTGAGADPSRRSAVPAYASHRASSTRWREHLEHEPRGSRGAEVPLLHHIRRRRRCLLKREDPAFGRFCTQVRAAPGEGVAARRVAQDGRRRSVGVPSRRCAGRTATGCSAPPRCRPLVQARHRSEGSGWWSMSIRCHSPEPAPERRPATTVPNGSTRTPSTSPSGQSLEQLR